MSSMMFARSLAAILLYLTMSGLAMAQNAAGPILLTADAVAVRKAEQQISAAREKLQSIDQSIAVPSLSTKLVNEKRAEIEKLRAETLVNRQQLDAPIKTFRDQITKLGDAPKEDETESDTIAAERKRLNDALQQYESLGKQFDLLNGEIGRLVTKITELQQRNFVRKVLEPSRSVLNPLLWIDGVAQVPQFIQRVSVLLSPRQSFSNDETRRGAMINRYAVLLLLIALACALTFIWVRWANRNPDPNRHDEFYRLWRAVRVALASALAIGAGFSLSQFTFHTAGIENPRLERIVDAALTGAFLFFCTFAIAKGIFRPRRPEMRLVNVDNRSAGLAVKIIFLLVLITSIDVLIDTSAGLVFMPVAFLVFWQAVLAITQILLLASLLIVLRRSKANEAGLIDEQGLPVIPATKKYFSWTGYVFHLIWLSILIAVVALASGYVSFAGFLITNLVRSAALVSILYLLHHLVDAAVNSALDPQSTIGRLLQQNFGFGEKVLSRLGVLFSTVMDFAIVIVGLPLLLGLWALTWIDLGSWSTAALAGVKVGDVTISPYGILLGIGVLVLGIGVARLLANWLDNRVLARLNMDSGVRNSVTTGTRYAGFVIAAGVAATSAGLDFSNFAIIAGALSVGIGFGLQSIVNNFVSGLILLAERPIKVGDWISVSGGEGIVKNINVRSTEIETFDRCSVIVPNSSLIADSVSNWYHSGQSGRVRVSVGVSYDSDPREVEKILLRCAVNHSRVLAIPAPFVVFMDYGASSLDFELRAYVDDVGYVLTIGSDLRFAIFAALKEAGIEIPFPQRDVNLRMTGQKDLLVENDPTEGQLIKDAAR